MKSPKVSHGKSARPNSGDVMRKAVKLEPIKKSTKERREMYKEIEEDDPALYEYKKRDSVLDYYDDED